MKFPDYEKITKDLKNMMGFREEWKLIENKFDQYEVMEPKETEQTSLESFCLSDFYIIQKWIDYAKGIEDKSVKIFNDRPIIFKDIYELAKQRINS